MQLQSRASIQGSIPPPQGPFAAGCSLLASQPFIVAQPAQYLRLHLHFQDMNPLFVGWLQCFFPALGVMLGVKAV